MTPLPSWELPATLGLLGSSPLHNLPTLEQLSKWAPETLSTPVAVSDLGPSLTAGHCPGAPRSLGTTAPLTNLLGRSQPEPGSGQKRCNRTSSNNHPWGRGSVEPEAGLPSAAWLASRPSVHTIHTQEKQLVPRGSQKRQGPQSTACV